MPDIKQTVTDRMFTLYDLAKSKGLVDTQGEWLEKIGSHPRIASQLKNYTVGFQLEHIQKAVELVNVDYNFVFGYKGGNDATIERIRTVLSSLLEVLPETKKGQKPVKRLVSVK